VFVSSSNLRTSHSISCLARTFRSIEQDGDDPGKMLQRSRLYNDGTSPIELSSHSH
jgi:hypothetical protein